MHDSSIRDRVDHKLEVQSSCRKKFGIRGKLQTFDAIFEILEKLFHFEVCHSDKGYKSLLYLVVFGS